MGRDSRCKDLPLARRAPPPPPPGLAPGTARAPLVTVACARAFELARGRGASVVCNVLWQSPTISVVAAVEAENALRHLQMSHPVLYGVAKTASVGGEIVMATALGTVGLLTWKARSRARGTRDTSRDAARIVLSSALTALRPCARVSAAAASPLPPPFARRTMPRQAEPFQLMTLILRRPGTGTPAASRSSSMRT